MDPPNDRPEPLAKGSGLFTTTHWSVVLAAGQRDAPQAGEALEKLCRAYWYPLYAYVRRRGCEVPDAQDLTQEFFHRLLDRDWLAQVARRKGKFRSFLLVAINHFLANEWDRTKTVKRGGRCGFVPLETTVVEAEF